MEFEGDKLLRDVKDLLEKQKRRLSDSSIEESSPKRPAHDKPDLPDSTPDWGWALAKFLSNRINSIEGNLNQSIEFATDTATQALTEICTMKLLFRDQCRKMDDIVYQVEHLKAENKYLREKVNNVEDQSRRDNLLYYGFKEERGETDQDCMRKTYELLRYRVGIPPQLLAKMKVVRAHRKGPYVPGKDRPIIVKMHFFPDKQHILSKAPALAGTGYYINEDFSADTEANRRELYPVMKEARKSSVYKDKTHIFRDKIVCEGKVYTADTLCDLPEPLNPTILATQTTPTLVKFFKKQSLFSNFNRSKLVINGINYECMEQYYQETKSEFFEDHATSIKIMSTKNPATMYHYGQNVKGFDEAKWRTVCDKVMLTGLLEKFKAPKYKNALLKTGNRKLVECNGKDFYWGAGCYMNQPESNDPARWRGQNKLGQLLEEVRRSFKRD